MELTIVLPAINEADNLSLLLPKVHDVARTIGPYEILVVDGGSTDDTATRAAHHGARVLLQKERGYGHALKEAFQAARGKYVVTMDADYSHDPSFIRDLYAARHRGAVVIASRYCPGGASDVSGLRSVLSRILNAVFRRVLAIDIRDMSSGFRMYRAGALREVSITRRNFDALEEVLIKIVGMGHPVVEVPFTYQARAEGVSKARVIKFGLQLASTLHNLWQLRNGCDWCDYDWRAYDSSHGLQRWWQRKRHEIVMGWHRPGGRALDIGCGSSRILASVPGMIGLDVSLQKLRFMARQGCPALMGSVYTLPFPDHGLRRREQRARPGDLEPHERHELGRDAAAVERAAVEAEARELVGGQVDPARVEVLPHVAQDVRELHGDAESDSGLAEALRRRAQHRTEHEAHPAGHEATVAV